MKNYEEKFGSNFDFIGEACKFLTVVDDMFHGRTVSDFKDLFIRFEPLEGHPLIELFSGRRSAKDLFQSKIVDRKFP